MVTMSVSRPRLYDALLQAHLARRRQMAFLSGPRQVGKTTSARAAGDAYLSWDDADHRRVLLRGPQAIVEHLGLARLRADRPVLVLDEVHKFRRWRGLVKGLFDTHGADLRVVVTGSARLDAFRRGGDSLMGRYLPYRMHPFSVGEVVDPTLPEGERLVRRPRAISEADWVALSEHGGFPEPFVERDKRFTRRWGDLRRQQLVREDVRDLATIQDLGQLEVLATLLGALSGTQLTYSRLADDVQVSVDTIRRWLTTLVSLHHGFLVRPWFRNVPRSLRKEPKWYLRDWSGVADPGQRAETLVACHLLKAVETWEDLGLGEFKLGYLRDKHKREVDFVVVREGAPWILIEVKHADEALSPTLAYYQERLKAPFAFQLVLQAPFVAADPLARPRSPLVVPARTLLSQLP